MTALTTEDAEAELLEHLKAEYLDLCRESFWEFCKNQVPDHYTDDRTYLKEICDTLQSFVEDRLHFPDGRQVMRVIINMPPRHGKSLTVQLLCQWVFGRWPKTRICAASYNTILSSQFAHGVRDPIMEQDAPEGKFIFADMFPEVSLKRGSAAIEKWALEGCHQSFLATSPDATLTGFGAHIGIIDDLVKNAQEAMNETALENNWKWYSNTFKSRMEQKDGFEHKEIVIETRWATLDLTGRLLKEQPEEWYTICLPAYDEKSEKMLCDTILSRKTFLELERLLDPVVFAGNYQQKPFDSGERLYRTFDTYRPAEAPRRGKTGAYVDTADQGTDFLAGGTWIEYEGKAYITDIIYTQEAMEKTEPDTAAMLERNKVKHARIESNNGGRGFARNVKEHLIKRGVIDCQVEWFHQGENKWARILTHATSVCNVVVMPEDWASRWPLFFLHVTRASRVAQPKPDDAHDFLTGVVESIQASPPLSMSPELRAAMAARGKRRE